MKCQAKKRLCGTYANREGRAGMARPSTEIERRFRHRRLAGSASSRAPPEKAYSGPPFTRGSCPDAPPERRRSRKAGTDPTGHRVYSAALSAPHPLGPSLPQSWRLAPAVPERTIPAAWVGTAMALECGGRAITSCGRPETGAAAKPHAASWAKIHALSDQGGFPDFPAPPAGRRKFFIPPRQRLEPKFHAIASTRRHSMTNLQASGQCESSAPKISKLPRAGRGMSIKLPTK